VAAFKLLALVPGKTDALLPRSEIIPGEQFKPGDRVQAYLSDVALTPRGPQLYLSRTSPKYLMKLFEVEVPEIREQIVEILDRLFWPLVLCSSTTIVAFFSLEWSVLPGYQSLGHFAVLGFSGATLFAIFILPLLVPLQGKAAARPPLVPVARLFPALFGWSARRRGLVIAFLIVSSLACLPGLLRLRFEGDYQKMNAVSPRVKSDMERITAIFGSAMPGTSLVVRGGDLEASLRENEKLYGLLKDKQRRGEIESVQSIAPLLPSQSAQTAARRRWRSFWNPARMEALRLSLNQAAAELRMRPGVFAPFLASLGGAGQPVTLDALQNGLFKQLASLHVARAAEGAPVLTSLTLAPKTDDAQFFATLRASGTSFAAVQGRQLMAHIVGLIYREMLWVSVITILLVVAILVGYYRAWRDLALILLPLLVGLYWTFGIMGWFDLRVNLMNSLIVVFVFGVVVDYSLFLATALRGAASLDDPHLAHSSVGITVSALTTMIGLGVLVVARHPALHSIGLTSLLGIGTGLVAVFSIIPLARRSPTPNPIPAHSSHDSHDSHDSHSPVP
jgi:predicted exporter